MDFSEIKKVILNSKNQNFRYKYFIRFRPLWTRGILKGFLFDH